MDIEQNQWTHCEMETQLLIVGTFMCSSHDFQDLSY